ncbi:hypothetical protein PPROV_001022800 [Pycnococcus provasolii]|uniref:Uncharacterized protein n=1 Tax=Pycnococcus provasolii TaxID=41880 RepID=A0A830I0B5_9CHLO|nr:hypothetical protein PPROV_001022800 [Pycnococcus provasolii]
MPVPLAGHSPRVSSASLGERHARQRPHAVSSAYPEVQHVQRRMRSQPHGFTTQLPSSFCPGSSAAPHAHANKRRGLLVVQQAFNHHHHHHHHHAHNNDNHNNNNAPGGSHEKESPFSGYIKKNGRRIKCDTSAAANAQSANTTPITGIPEFNAQRNSGGNTETPQHNQPKASMWNKLRDETAPPQIKPNTNNDAPPPPKQQQPAAAAASPPPTPTPPPPTPPPPAPAQNTKNTMPRLRRPTAHLRNPDNTPLSEDNRDRLMGLLTERATKTLLMYCTETNQALFHWLHAYLREHPIPRDGSWEDVNGDSFLRGLLNGAQAVVRENPSVEDLYNNADEQVIDPRQVAQRIIEIRGQIAEEFRKDLDDVKEENQWLLMEVLMASLHSMDFMECTDDDCGVNN